MGACEALDEPQGALGQHGSTEAEDANEEQLGLEPVSKLLEAMHGCDPVGLLATIDAQVNDYIGDAPAGDDVTMLALSRCV